MPPIKDLGAAGSLLGNSYKNRMKVHYMDPLPIGPQGVQGTTGIQGEKGSIGVQGPAGLPGQAGSGTGAGGNLYTIQFHNGHPPQNPPPNWTPSLSGNDNFILYTQLGGAQTDEPQIGLSVDKTNLLQFNEFKNFRINSKRTGGYSDIPSVSIDTSNFSPVDPGVVQNKGRLTLTPEPTLSNLGQSIISNSNNNTEIGVQLMSQIISNETKGIISLWQSTPKNIQAPSFIGHDHTKYTSFNPLQDCILDTKTQHSSPNSTVSMDLGMSSRIPIIKNGYNWNSNQWQDVTGPDGYVDDNPYKDDPYAESGGQQEWEGQKIFKSAVPGLYIEEKRWDRVISNKNYLGEVSLRSTFAPTVNMNNIPVKGIDFYDLELGGLKNDKTFGPNDYMVHGTFNMTNGDLSKNRPGSGSGGIEMIDNPNLFYLTTNSAPKLTHGVTFDHNKFGSSYMYFQKNQRIDPNSATFETTALIDGLTGSIKATNSLTTGNTHELSDNVITTTSSINLKRKINNSHESYISIDRNSQEQGRIRLYDEEATTTPALTLTAVHPQYGSSPIHKTVDMKTGYAYFENGFAGALNNDRVGVVHINNTHTNTTNDYDVLNINSEWDITSNTTPKQNIIGCTNSTSTVNGPMFSVRTDGQMHSKCDQLITQFIVHNTYANGAPVFNYNETIMKVQSDNPGRTAPVRYDGFTNVNGFTFVKHDTPQSSSGSQTQYQIDGDGSIKCRTSISLIEGKKDFPATDTDTHILTLLPNKSSLSHGGDKIGSWITTEYSDDSNGCPIYIKAFGTSINTSTFDVANMVNIVENEIIPVGSRDSSVINLCLRNDTSVDDYNNYFWMNRHTGLGNNQSIRMECGRSGATSGNLYNGLRPTFNIRKGGVIDETSQPNGSIESYILNYNPNYYYSPSNNYNPSSNSSGSYLMIGDERERQVVRIGTGIKNILPGGSASNTRIASISNNTTQKPGNLINGTILDAQTLFGDVVLCRHIATGNTQDILKIGDREHCGAIHIDLSDGGHIKTFTTNNYTRDHDGPTNVCSSSNSTHAHNGYIGTYRFAVTNGFVGTGLRGNTVQVNTVAAAVQSAFLKLYTAKLSNTLGYDDHYFTPTTLESPQGLIVFRGQIEMMDNNGQATNKARINIDTAVSDTLLSCNVIVPHTLPNSMLDGTFKEMFKNPTLHVTNAGIRTQQSVRTTNYSPDFSPIFGYIDTLSPPSTFLEINVQAPVNNLCVNYVIYAERADKEYITAGTQGDTSLHCQFVKSYTNEFLNPVAPHEETTFTGVMERTVYEKQFSVDLDNPGH